VARNGHAWQEVRSKRARREAATAPTEAEPTFPTGWFGLPPTPTSE